MPIPIFDTPYVGSSREFLKNLIIQNVAIRNNVTFGPTEQSATLVGFLAWRLCIIVLTRVPSSIEMEAQTGTLENVIMSTNVSLSQLIIIRTFTRSVFAVVETLILSISMSFLFSLQITFTPAALLIAILMLLGIWGISFAIAGIALVYKSVLSIVGIIANLALIISMTPVSRLGILGSVIKWIFPLTWGVELLRKTLLFNATLITFVNEGELLGLLLQTIILFAGGLYLFNLLFRRAKRLGVLGTY